jgi:hypothetical protein
MRNVLHDLHVYDGDEDRKPALIRTDQGKEFSSVAEASQDIHQSKDVRDTNGVAIVDRAIQSIKRDLAAEVGKKRGTKWTDVVQKVVDDHNEKPQSAVFGPPDEVRANPIQEFKVLQKNAENYEVNRKNTDRMKDAVRKAEFVREPIDNGGRSFKPRYGPAMAVENVDSEFVYHKGFLNELEKGKTGDDYKTLLKQAKPATVGQLQQKLTLDTDLIRKPQAKTVLKNQAQSLENVLLKEGSISVEDLTKKVTGLKRKTKRYKNLTESNWITRAFKDKFTVQDGIVRLKSAPSSSSVPPAPPPPAAPTPAAPVPKAKVKKDANFFKGLSAAYGKKPMF